MFYHNIFPRHRFNFTNGSFKIAFKNLFFKKANHSETRIQFEKKFAEYIGSNYAQSVSSARSGLDIVLKSYGFPSDSEIIIPMYTFHTIPVSVISNKLKPLCVDIDPTNGNINPQLIENLITDNTRAIILTHMCGIPCEMDQIVHIAEKHGLKIIEDCAHALGGEYNNKKLGTIGDVGIFSFNKGKMLPCFGGGMIVTNDSQLFGTIKSNLEQCGYPTKISLLKKVLSCFMYFALLSRQIFPFTLYPVIKLLSALNLDWVDQKIVEKKDIQMNSREIGDYKLLSGMQAAVGIQGLKDLDQMLQCQKEKISLLTKNINNNVYPIKFLRNNAVSSNALIYFKIYVDKPKEWQSQLLKRGIDTKLEDMSLCAEYLDSSVIIDEFPHAKKLYESSLTIPIHHSFSDGEVSYIAQKIGELSKACHEKK